MNRRALFLSPLALVAVIQAAVAAPVTENVQPHSKMREWRHIRDAMGRGASIQDVRAAAVHHFGGPHAVMTYSADDGQLWRVEVCGVAQYDYCGPDIVALIEGKAATVQPVRFDWAKP